MTSKLELLRARRPTRERLIVALDVDDLNQAKGLVQALASEVGMFKVGKQLFTHAGPQAVRLIQELGGEVFLDLKFHDIPNTVAKAAVEATRMGVKMFNVHASGSLEMMRMTVKEVRRVCRQEKRRRPIMLAVTVLTSLNQSQTGGHRRACGCSGGALGAVNQRSGDGRRGCVSARGPSYSGLLRPAFYHRYPRYPSGGK
jgi:orotidine-5'-phosphate decarboxylase